MGLSSKHVSNNDQDRNHGLLYPPSEDSGRGCTLELPNPPTKRREEQEKNVLKCPRCDSMNTKFYYYNNYNKLQPRHFCKACKRHWTKGGMLRSVPMGGGRKNKRLKTTKATNVKSSHARTEIIGPQFLAQESLFNSFKSSEFNHSSTIFGGSSRLSSMPQNHDSQLQFPCPSFITADNSFPCSVPSNSWPTKESTINWGWDEIDNFVTTDITLPWDDADIISFI